MLRGILLLGWILAGAMVGVLAFVNFSQWQGLKERENSAALALSRGLTELDQKLELSNSRWQSLLEAIRKEGQDQKQMSSAPLPEPATADTAGGAPAHSERGEVSESQVDSTRLSPIPEGIRAKDVVEMDLAEILSDSKLNPNEKRLSGVAAARARAELVRAQSEINILDSEVRLGFHLGMEELKPGGEFVEYPPGQKYQTFAGVLTSGEVMRGGGIRMFYFYPERFPEIYEKVTKKAEIAELATRRILTMLRE